MLGLVLKDLYNILNNIKSLVLILLVLSITFLPNLGTQSYITTCAIICSMIIITTMNFDYNSKWDRFALTTPISRKDIVISKYISLFIFILFGTIFSSLISLISSLFIKNIALSKILESIPISIFIVMFFSSFLMPLLYMFGTEKARMLMLLVFLLPLGVIYLLSKLINKPSEKALTILICIAPIVIILLFLASILVSLKIYKLKEV